MLVCSLPHKVQRVVSDVITDCDGLTPQAVQPFSGVLAHVSRNPDTAAPVAAWLLARCQIGAPALPWLPPVCTALAARPGRAQSGVDKTSINISQSW